MRLLQIAITAGVVYYLSDIVADPPELEQYAGGYFEFAMIGLMVMSVASLGIGTFNANIMAEQTLGTMEVLLATPTPLAVLLAGSFVFPLMLTAVDIVLYFTVGLGLLGTGLSVDGVLLSIPLLVLTLATFCAFGVAGASIVVLAKRGDPFTAPAAAAHGASSAGRCSRSRCFPPVIEWIARAFPAYYGINGLRDALLGSGGVARRRARTSPCSPGSPSSSYRRRCGCSPAPSPRRVGRARSATTDPAAEAGLRVAAAGPGRLHPARSGPWRARGARPGCG